jgi:hypothetical protein
VLPFTHLSNQLSSPQRILVRALRPPHLIQLRQAELEDRLSWQATLYRARGPIFRTLSVWKSSNLLSPNFSLLALPFWICAALILDSFHLPASSWPFFQRVSLVIVQSRMPEVPATILSQEQRRGPVPAEYLSLSTPCKASL